MFKLLSTYKLPYGHLIHNNQNFWLKTTKLSVFKYPNIKVKRHSKEEPLKIFNRNENKIYYRNIFIINVNSVDENKLLAYKFIRTNDEIILKEYKIYIIDYFKKIMIFNFLFQCNNFIDELKFRYDSKIENNILIERNGVLLKLKCKSENSLVVIIF